MENLAICSEKKNRAIQAIHELSTLVDNGIKLSPVECKFPFPAPHEAKENTGNA